MEIRLEEVDAEAMLHFLPGGRPQLSTEPDSVYGHIVQLLKDEEEDELKVRLAELQICEIVGEDRQTLLHAAAQLRADNAMDFFLSKVGIWTHLWIGCRADPWTRRRGEYQFQDLGKYQDYTGWTYCPPSCSL